MTTPQQTQTQHHKKHGLMSRHIRSLVGRKLLLPWELWKVTHGFAAPNWLGTKLQKVAVQATTSMFYGLAKVMLSTQRWWRGIRSEAGR